MEEKAGEQTPPMDGDLQIAMTSVRRNRDIISTTKADRLWFTNIYAVLLVATVGLAARGSFDLGNGLTTLGLGLLLFLGLVGLLVAVKADLTRAYFLAHSMRLRRDHNLAEIIPLMAYDAEDPLIRRATRYISVGTAFVVFYLSTIAGLLYFVLSSLGVSESLALGAAIFTFVLLAGLVAVLVVGFRRRAYKQAGVEGILRPSPQGLTDDE